MTDMWAAAGLVALAIAMLSLVLHVEHRRHRG